MGYKTVNLQPSTYERLKEYQVGGKSLSDVIDQLMDLAEPEEFYRKALRIHRRRVRELRKSGGLSIAEAARALKRKD